MEPIWRWQPVEAISLRDYFAAQVLTSFTLEHMPPRAAELAYQYADAMLASRTQEPPK